MSHEFYAGDALCTPDMFYVFMIGLWHVAQGLIGVI